MDEEEIDLISLENGLGAVVSSGDLEDYNNLMEYVKSNDINDENIYNSLCNMIEIDEYINYQAVEIILGNRDWVGNNVKLWKKKNNGKWRWILFDTDYAFGLGDIPNSHNTLLYAMREGEEIWLNHEYGAFLFRTLCSNEIFKNKFIDAISFHLGDSFNKLNINRTLDSISNKIADEIDYHYNRWPLTANYDSWSEHVEIMRNWILNRHDHVLTHVKDRFELGEIFPITIRTNDDSSLASQLFINDLKVSQSQFNGKLYKNRNYKINIKPSSNLQFKKWILIIERDNSSEIKEIIENDINLNFEDDVKSVEILADVMDENLSNSLDNNILENTITISLNNNMLNINSLSEINSDIQIEIYDVLGNLKFNKIIRNRMKNNLIDVTNAGLNKNGVYIIRLNINNETVINKLKVE